MRRHEREITDRAEMETVLARATVVHLAMVDDGRPYLVPLNFGYADGCLYLHGAKEGRKIAVLRRSPAVCFNLFTDEAIVPGAAPAGCNFTSRYRSVTGTGRVEFLENDDAKRHGLDVIMAHYASGPFTYRPDVFARTCVFRIVIESMTGKKANM
jgi:nitroimidazol reductase NimA-like FMN-containing flavoprotein (pyridoxamine 5'-phosphate oxidase superfamily)